MSTKVAVVTGVSYGLGENFAKKLLEKGFKVYGISRSQPHIKNTGFEWLQADLTNDSELTKVISKISEADVNLLVNNAGVAFLKAALDFTDEDFNKVFGVNFVSPIKLTAKLLPKLKGGLVINISSVSDRYPDPKYGLYGSSKAALNLYFETIGNENPNLKIVNLLPNYIETPMQHQLNDKNKEFDWKICMTTQEVTDALEYVINHASEIDSGTRVIVQSDIQNNGVYNPEKLYFYNVTTKEMKKVSL